MYAVEYYAQNVENLDLALLAIQLAESLESDQRLISDAFKHALRGGADEVYVSFLDLLLFGTNTDLAGSLCADDDAGAVDGFESGLCARLVEVSLDDAEFLDRRVVEGGRGARAVGGGVEGYEGVVGRRHLLFADGSVGVGEHISEGVDVLELRGEASTNDVVGGSHALDDVWIVSVNEEAGREEMMDYLLRDRRECHRP